jgi:hypothetical protein
MKNSYFGVQLDFQPADIKHSSFRTMAQYVRRAMLPNNYTVFKNSFAEGTWIMCSPCVCALSDVVCGLQLSMEIKSLIFT